LKTQGATSASSKIDLISSLTAIEVETSLCEDATDGALGKDPGAMFCVTEVFLLFVAMPRQPTTVSEVLIRWSITLKHVMISKSGAQ